MQLRPYQLKALNDIRAAFRSGKRAPLLVSPTGSGKTIMFSAIAQGAMQKGKRVLIMAHRVELIDQIERALREFGITPGIIAANRAESPRALVQVARVFTLLRRLERFATFDLIICDEAHHCIAASSWGKVIAHYPQALVLGVTATPQRLGGEGLDDVFDDLILGPSVQELIDGGALSRVKVYAPPGPDLSGVHVRMGDYVQAEINELMSKKTIVGDAVEHYTRHSPGAPAVAFCVSVKHAAAVAAQFTERGYTSVSIDGSLDSALRRSIIADFSAGRIQVLTSCDVVSEGLDVPRIQTGILLRPTQSLSRYLQNVGRCLRPFPGKPHATILDHAGNTHRHGLATELREWSLSGTHRTQRNSGADGDIQNVRICEQCFAANPGGLGQCGECGTPFKTKNRVSRHIAGNLEEVTAESVGQVPRSGAGKRPRNDANDLAGLIALGRMRGYKNPAGWAAHILAARDKKRQQTVRDIHD